MLRQAELLVLLQPRGMLYFNIEYSNLIIHSDKLRLRLLEDHLKKHSLRDESHALCVVCRKILEGE